MRRELVVGVALLVLVAGSPATGLPGPVSASFSPRGPIVILDDSGFTAANGVVGGTGTPADPYVISGWHIAPPSGTAVLIRNVSASFVLRENVLEGTTGLRLDDARGDAIVQNNRFIVRGTGALVTNADARIADNAFLTAGGTITTGVSVSYSNADVHGNSFDSIHHAIRAERGTTNVTWNDIHRANVGISLHLETRSDVSNNTITVAHGTAMSLTLSVHLSVHGNLVWHAQAGVTLHKLKDVDFDNNTIRFSIGVGVLVQETSGNITGNHVLDGDSDAVQLWGSVTVMTRNRIENNLGVGIVSGTGACDIELNVVVSNGIGIQVNADAADPPHLRGNVLINNTVGLDIPYAVRQTVFWMEGNVVNGVNVDGTIDASQQVYFYKAANVSIQGGVRDSGFSAGYYGSISAQGNVVLYEVDTAWINGTVISHANVGVGIVNSFNVNVNGALIAQATVGVQARAIAVPHQVPPCVVSVKDTNVTVPVDPPQTVGIDVRGCIGLIARTEVSLVDTGIHVDALSTVVLEDVAVTGTKVGLDVVGRRDGVTISRATIEGNRVGARFVGTVGLVQDSRFANNTEVGIRLDLGADLELRRNNVTLNGQGVADARACAGIMSCSAVRFEDNVVLANRGDGIRVNGTTSFRGDDVLGNRGDGARLASATTVRDAVFAGNEGSGLVVAGAFEVLRSNFTGNEGNGADLRGTGTLRDSGFLRNDLAGLRIVSSYVTATRLDVSFNFDGILLEGVGGPAPSVNPTLSVPWLLGAGAGGAVGSPLDLHLSKLVGNQRDALRAGGAVVNATHNWWGSADGPSVSFGDQVGAFQNGVSPAVRFLPYFADEDMTTTGPLFLL